MANASQDGGDAKRLRGVHRLFWLFSTEIDLDQRMVADLPGNDEASGK